MELKDFFRQCPSVAIAFSGGVDSAYLLYEAQRYARKVTAYYVRSVFQPQFEYEDAVRFSKEYGVNLQVISVDVLQDEAVRKNPANRCYYCKRQIFGHICAAAVADGYTVVLDGTNASDAEDDRPGMQAIRELAVRSPLRECELTKEMIRMRSKEVGLFTWNKPAYACLATRIPSGEMITEEKLQRTEMAETYLHSLGFVDFRVREYQGAARIQIREEQLPLLMQERDKIQKHLQEMYVAVFLDLEARVSCKQI